MNALNASSKLTVTREWPPLVVDLGNGYFAWIQNGHGFTLHTSAGQWHPITDVVYGIGGSVLNAALIAALVLEFGRPL